MEKTSSAHIFTKPAPLTKAGALGAGDVSSTEDEAPKVSLDLANDAFLRRAAEREKLGLPLEEIPAAAASPRAGGDAPPPGPFGGGGETTSFIDTFRDSKDDRPMRPVFGPLRPPPPPSSGLQTLVPPELRANMAPKETGMGASAGEGEPPSSSGQPGKDADVAAEDRVYETTEDLNEAFLQAAQCNDVDAIKMALGNPLLKDPNVPDEEGYTALIYASEKGFEEVVKVLVSDERVNPFRPNKKKGNTHTAIIKAVCNGHYQLAQHLAHAQYKWKLKHPKLYEPSTWHKAFGYEDWKFTPDYER